MKIKHKKILIGVCIVFIFCGAGVSCYQITKNYIDNTIQAHIERLADAIDGRIDEDIKNELETYIEDEVKDELKDYIENKVKDDIKDEVEDDLKFYINSELKLELENYIEDEVRDKVDDAKFEIENNL